jgi:hypothetical protein
LAKRAQPFRQESEKDFQKNAKYNNLFQPPSVLKPEMIVFKLKRWLSEIWTMYLPIRTRQEEPL